MIDKYYKYIEFEKRYASHTIISYKNDISQFIEFLLVNYEIEDVHLTSHFHIRSWLVYLLQNNISTRSINRKLSTLRSLFKFLKKNGLIDTDPLRKILPPKVSKRLPDYVPEHKMCIDQNHMDRDDNNDYSTARNHLMIDILYQTGIRRSELIALMDTSVDFVKQEIKVLGKGNKERIIPISAKLVDEILSYISLRNDLLPNRASFLLLTDKGKKMYPKLVYNIVNKLLSLVTTNNKRSPHVLRHSFATHLLNNGADLNAIKELLGHANLSATQVYTHNSIDQLRKVYDEAHPKA